MWEGRTEMETGWRVVVRYDHDFHGVAIWFMKTNEDGSRHLVQPINMTITTEYHEYEMFPEPTIRIDARYAHEFLQSLASGLIEAGYIPDQLKAKNGEIEALKEHLNDMRAIVYNALLPPELIPPTLERMAK